MIRGGKSFVSSPPAFSNDAKKLLVATSNTVSIFSTSTGMLITELEGHTALVTSVIVVPNSNSVFCYCWTSSLDGTIRYWDFSAPELIKAIDIRQPIFSMVVPSLLSRQDEGDGKPADVFAYMSIEGVSGHKNKPKSLLGQIRKCNLTESRLVGGVNLAETTRPAFITMSPSSEFFGIQNKRTLHIWKVPAKDYERAVVKRIKLHHTKDFSSFAFHPFDQVVAAGDVTGRILVWRGFGSRRFSNDSMKGRSINNEDEKAGVRGDDDAESCSTWHWHSSEVNLLSFSSDGAHLYSGGNEGVLVMWQLDTGKKRFLPRIGSPLLYFVDSPDSLLSSMSCADNQIHILNTSSMEILKSIAGIKLPCSFPDTWSGLSRGFVFDHAAGLVAVRAENYCVQFYSLFDDRENSQVQFVKGTINQVVITLVALSPDGTMMSTAETVLSEEGIGGVVSLKFWACKLQKKDFKLSTIVYEPHRDAAISAMTFHPSCPIVVTSSYGGDFKVWICSHVSQDADKVTENSGWTCHSVGSYKGKPMTAATFSADGSVLAVAAETVITLWDPDRNFLVAVIGETLAPIVSLSFVGISEYLVSASHGSKPQLSVWCMSKLSTMWSYKLHAEAVACTDDASSFAVLALLPESPNLDNSNGTRICSTNGVILLFNVEDPVPIATWNVRKANGGGLSFLQQSESSLENNTSVGKQPSALLVYINGDHEYVVFDPYSKEVKKLSLTRQDVNSEHEERGRFGYTALYGELPAFERNKETSEVAILPSERPWETIFSGSSHNLPPLTRLCSSFLESLLEKRTSAII
ncbi:hypothetical protein Ancab_029982 [Ancistrocladus abbreviatus]